MKNRLPLLVLALPLTSLSLAQQLMVVESTNDRVMLVDATTGAMVNPNFIDLTTSTGSAPVTPQEAKVAPNGEIWISDQVADTIFRFSQAGVYLGESSAALDNVRGFEIAFGSVWVTNAGSSNGAPGQALVQLDMNLDFVAAYTGMGSPFDAVQFTLNGVTGLLVSDITNDTLHFFDPLDPTNPLPFIDSDGITGFDFPEQINLDNSTGNIRITSLVTPNGFWEFDKVTGAQLDHVDTQVLFGHSILGSAYELGNGTIMYSHGQGLRIYDPSNMSSTPIVENIASRYINSLSGGGLVSFCDPANVNSTGGPVSISGSLSGGSLHLEASGGPDGEFGYFLVGTGASPSSTVMLSNGLLCLTIGAGNSIGRYNVSGGNLNSIGRFDGAGVYQNMVGTSTTGTGYDVPALLPLTGSPSIMAGDTWHFQLWYRDSLSGPGQSNLSNGLTVDF